MKKTILLISCGVALASCNKGGQVSVTNASGNQVAEAVAKSDVMNSDTMIQPGQWQSKLTFAQMDMPGLSPQIQARMKQAMAARAANPRTMSHCYTAEELKKPKADFFGADKSCTYDHFTMGGGKIDIAMTCHEENMTRTTTMVGSYTPTTYSMDMDSHASGGAGPMGGSMKFHVDAQRVGECTGKEED